MSKINPVQLAALKAATSPVAKSNKTTTVKSSPTKTIATKLASPKTKADKQAANPIMAKAKVTTTKTRATVKQDKVKTRKAKMERDSFTMPRDEYAQLAILKSRLVALGQPTKKSEVLRAGVKLLVAMTDNTLKTTLSAIPIIKTGRPNKK